jgi:hypothetical protein
MSGFFGELRGRAAQAQRYAASRLVKCDVREIHRKSQASNFLRSI